MEGEIDVQVGGALHRKRRWGAGVNERALKMNGCRWGGGRKEGETNGPEIDRRKRWGIRDRLKVLRINEESLGAEGSMSEVGIPPPHNLYKNHAPWPEITMVVRSRMLLMEFLA